MGRWVSSRSYQAAISILVGARRQAGLTQRDLASRLAKPPSFIAKIETGERRLDIVEFVAIARVLGIPPDTIIGKIDAAIAENIDI